MPTAKEKAITPAERMRRIRMAIRRETFSHKLHAPNTTMVLPWEADLISVTAAGLVQVLRPAPRLHKTKITDKQVMSLLRAMHFRYWNYVENS